MISAGTDIASQDFTPLGGEKDANHADDKIFVCSNKSSSHDPEESQRMPTIDPKDLIGCMFLKETEADGQRFRARIVHSIIEKDAELKRDTDHIKFLSEVDGDTADAIYTYNQVLDFIERDSLDIESNREQMYRFHCIRSHQGTLRTSDRDYNGSTYNVLVDWESGDTMYEHLDIIDKDDPMSFAEDGKRNGLLDTPGWIRFRHHVKNNK